MYRCERCQVVVPPRTPARRLVVATRLVDHPYRKSAGVRTEGKRPKPYDDPGGTGTQIVWEQVVCPECARKD